MVYKDKNFDLTLLSDRFTTCGDYTVDIVLEELEYYQDNGSILILLSGDIDNIDGFLIAYPDRSSLWIAQMWRKTGSDLATSREAIEVAKDWAREKGLSSLSGETKRREMSALKRYGFEEFSVNMICQL